MPIQAISSKPSKLMETFEWKRTRCQEMPGIEVHKIEYGAADGEVAVRFIMQISEVTLVFNSKHSG